ncbi:MAG TPA: response regulator, partial [Candidatus Binataceae bacterium]|nr:response regulator [Candidatus Binataceae bacterium]
MAQGFEMQPKQREAIQQSRILIIDDQPSNIALLEKILHQNGYVQYRSIADSRATIREFQEFQPDLILLDLMMPELDGYAILAELQSLIRPETYLPILVITADASQKAKRRALSLGTKDFITKPIDATETILRIENLLKTRWLYGQVRQQTEDLLATNRQLRASNRELSALQDRIVSLMRQADGELRYESDSLPPQAANSDEMLIRIGDLISARRRVEEQLRQAQKMEAVGRLAAGIAHDFNNLLTVIIGYNDFLRNEVRASPKNLEYALEVSHSAERASALTKQLLAFSRQQIARPRVVNLNEVVQQIARMLRRILEEHIELAIDLGSNVDPVKVDPAQIDQVLMNLVVNARDAMPEGGCLRIETSAVELSESDDSGFAGLHPGRYAVLAITDTGTGMDALTQTHLFEPFFTTKGNGKGTGLGLSIVHGIVSQNGGDISVETE